MKIPFLEEAFLDATENVRYGYLFIDLTPEQDRQLRISTAIFSDEQRYFYLKSPTEHRYFYK